MSTISNLWDTTWTATSIAGSTVTNTSSATTAAIDNSAHAGAEISVTVAYGGTATQGLVVNILRMVDDTPTYESATNDSPFGFAMPYSTSTTFHRTISVAGDRVSKFKVYVSNNTGASVTVTVKYKQYVVQIV